MVTAEVGRMEVKVGEGMPCMGDDVEREARKSIQENSRDISKACCFQGVSDVRLQLESDYRA